MLGGFTAADKAGPSKFGDRGCMWIFYGDPPNLQEIIRSEIEKKPGRLLITSKRSTYETVFRLLTLEKLPPNVGCRTRCKS